MRDCVGTWRTRGRGPDSVLRELLAETPSLVSRLSSVRSRPAPELERYRSLKLMVVMSIKVLELRAVKPPLRTKKRPLGLSCHLPISVNALRMRPLNGNRNSRET
jgi:hypothetical protein